MPNFMAGSDSRERAPPQGGWHEADNPVPRSHPIVQNATLGDWVMRTLPAALARAWARFLVSPARTGVRLSPKRRRALAVAVPSSAALMVATFALVRSPGRLERLPVAPLLLFVLVAHLINAVVTVELFRRVLPRSETWSDRRHFSIVGIVWLALFAAGSALVLAGRAALRR